MSNPPMDKRARHSDFQRFHSYLREGGGAYYQIDARGASAAELEQRVSPLRRGYWGDEPIGANSSGGRRPCVACRASCIL
jgi:hypothetical protein